MSSEDAVPAERCGFVLEPGDVPEHAQAAIVGPYLLKPVRDYEPGSDEWYEASDAVCCWREVWDASGGDRCIWHADMDDKPPAALVDARADRPERLDGASVPAIELGDVIDFEGCRLLAATFDGTALPGASFEGVNGPYAQFPDADLRGAQFPDADLFRAQFPDAALRHAQFSDADLSFAEFPNANLWWAQFPDADLSGAQSPDADFRWAEFPNADLRWAQFPDADLRRAEFPDARLVGTQFPDADLQHAHFSNADLRDADLSDTDAAHATFTRADLRAGTLTNADLGDADLTKVHIHDAHLRDVRINARTTIGTVAPEEANADWFAAGDLSLRDRLRWWLTWWRADPDTPDAPTDQLDRAHTVYRTIQRLYRENSMPEEIAEYQMRAKDARRKQALRADDRLRWLYLATQRWVMGYGERPWRVVATSGAMVLGSALAYLLVGPIAAPSSSGQSPTVGGALLSSVPVSPPGWLAEPLTSLYFSVVTFTTLGYGDLQPATGVAQAIATVESLVGAFLLALLVYVLGRRATR